MTSIDLKPIVEEVVKKIKEKSMIEVEASGRHVHLSKDDLYSLFGEGYELNVKKELSQPGQFQSSEKVMLVGKKGVIKDVSILGPVRNKTQVEISKTDALILGINPTVRDSGDIENSEGIILLSQKGFLQIKEGVIIAKRHIHMTPEDSKYFKVQDKEIVKVKIYGERPLIFEDVLVRVSDNYKLNMHIDYDEANACGYIKGVKAEIIK
ncbi:propanediol utilization protein [Clostridium tetanomorphum]|uniref:Phosphate propanoyltransferase n=2 Tax=Clostridium tetanomorphum TaxID=1553 RepID=A0A923E5R5_CLOTT|nr:phosphate propanoyltransferase [Clostridium tetanomorphum]KAJ52578.1 propanediol utilization phosphotransacylase [Clostridium tetanomorphum DSM 665]MBC2396868.1 phosphate propanoyltransferase [Clostridium tetanomorphum]MBP1863170.1 propanediol utilization protein [Clostridium tetanomorphum]NRS84278.1 propanediol utilization protein [Clostridium tetanomorphum]NRZ97492.1 propanediol utilization protein [Clostridium tetanomorphum]